MSSDEWKEVKAGDVVDTISITHKLNKEKIILINTSDVLDGKVLNHNYVVNENLRGQFKKSFQKGDILYSEIRPQNRRFAFVDFEAEDYVASTKLMVLRKKNDNINPKFLFHILKSSDVIRKLQMIAESRSGTFPQITYSELADLDIPLPLPEEQRAIAAILSALDDKIELNNRINKTLEEMAQALFKSWFVDFEFPDENGQPYKSSGGEMEESELGPIPKGWRVGNFNNLIAASIGGDWGKESRQEKYECEVFCMRGADIPELDSGNFGKMPIRFILQKNYVAKVLNENDIVIEISGGSPTQSTGRMVLISKELLRRFGKSLICSNFCRKISLKNKIYAEFLYMYLNFLYKSEVFFQFENGTTGIKNLDVNNLFDKYQIILPNEENVAKFQNIIKDSRRLIQENGRETQILANIRDALLPKLMSGEIRVPIEEVTADV